MRGTARIASVVVALGLLGSACADTIQPAATIGDAELSHSDLKDEVEQWAEQPALVQAIGVTPALTRGSANQQLVAVVLSVLIQIELAENALDTVDRPISDSARTAAEQQVGGLFAGLGERGDELVAGFAALEEMGQHPDAIDVFLSTPVEIHSRYGTFDRDTIGVTPPGGPLVGPDSFAS